MLHNQTKYFEAIRRILPLAKIKYLIRPAWMPEYIAVPQFSPSSSNSCPLSRAHEINPYNKIKLINYDEYSRHSVCFYITCEKNILWIYLPQSSNMC